MGDMELAQRGSHLSADDRRLLTRALDLAEQGRGRTSPNPMVGAVVTRDSQILGEGFHARAGMDHAEVAAMKAAAPGAMPPDFGGLLRGTTVYVSLEPCAHYGRTPPCADTLIAAGVARVVVAAEDPSPRVSGRGLARLRAAGVRVDVANGELEQRARRQNGPFRKWVTTGLPFVTYKYAMTLDGKVATERGHSAWISGAVSRRLVHEERAASDAVLVGAGTLRADDPLLTARDVAVERQPLRVVVDSHLSLSASSALVASAGENPTLIVCAASVDAGRVDEVRGWGIEVEPVDVDAKGRPSPQAVARVLGARGLQSVLMEGGPTLAAAWWESGLVDRVMAFVAPIVIGGAGAPGPLPARGGERMDEALRLKDARVERVGEDVLVVGFVGDPY